MTPIQTNGITILLVEVPEDAKAWSIKHHMDGTLRSLRVSDNETNYELFVLPQGQYQILGKSTELGEEQMKEICEEDEYGDYKDYNIDGDSWNCPQLSYLSLLEANGIVDRCNIQKPEFNYEFGEDGPTDSQLLSAEIHFEESFKQWQESQSKVKHYLVLKRI